MAGHQRPGRLRLGTVTGVITRRYHGLLIAALPAPLGRMMMLNHLSERLRLPDRRVVYTGGEELAGSTPEHDARQSAEFRLEAGLPVWRYEIGRLRPREAAAPAAPAEHGPHHLPPALAATGTLRLRPAPGDPLPLRTTRPVSAADGRRTC